MMHVLAIALLGLMLAGAAPPSGLPDSQSFADRLARIEQRIATAVAQHLILPAHDALLRVQVEATRRAQDAHDARAAGMLDVLERQLAPIDHALSRANDGQAIVVRTGDSVTLAMQDGYFYDVHNSNPAALAPRVGIMFTRGVQGLFIAKLPATVTLTLQPRSGTQPAAPPELSAPVVFTVVILPKQ